MVKGYLAYISASNDVQMFMLKQEANEQNIWNLITNCIRPLPWVWLCPIGDSQGFLPQTSTRFTMGRHVSIIPHGFNYQIRSVGLRYQKHPCTIYCLSNILVTYLQSVQNSKARLVPRSPKTRPYSIVLNFPVLGSSHLQVSPVCFVRLSLSIWT